MVMTRRALLLGTVASLAGCIVVAEEPHAVTVIDAEGYHPHFYHGYIVYYDADGLPIYYQAGVVHHVPRTYVHYGVLVRHYHLHRPRYRRWYRARGHRLRHYRRTRHRHRPRRSTPRRRRRR